MILFADQYASHLKHLDQQSIKVVKARQSGRTTTISVSGRKFTVRARFPPSDCLNNEHGHMLRLPRCFICFFVVFKTTERGMTIRKKNAAESFVLQALWVLQC